ncbi:MAG TPA: branched-chain amino acid ABC transporter permease [Acidimicrobiales bacterium]
MAGAAALGGIVAMATLLLASPVPAQEPEQEPEAPAATTTTVAPEGAGEPGEEAPSEDAPLFRGNLRYEDEAGEDVPVPDAEIAIEAVDGSFSETVTTDEDGRFEQVLPAPGRYRATLDVSTLPDGVALTSDSDTRTITLSPGQEQTLLFPLSTGEEAGGVSTLERVLDRTVDGLRFGLVIAMCAIGLSLIYGTTGLVNFAHGEMVTFGALMTWFFNRTIGMHIILAGILGIVAGGIFGGAFNRLVWRPLRNRGTGLVAMMIVSFGAGLALRNVFLYQFRGSRRSFKGYDLQREGIEIGPIEVIPRDLWIMGLSIVVLVGVALLLQKTLIGKAMRAVSDDPDLAESSGIDVERVIAWVWITGGGLAALGGIFQGLDQKVEWEMGNALLLLIFASVVLGGLGTAYGALVGAVTIGLLTQLSTLFVDTELRTAAALLVMIVILMLRPQGILGYPERVG